MNYAPLKRPEHTKLNDSSAKKGETRRHARVPTRSAHGFATGEHGAELRPSGRALVEALGPRRVHDIAASGLTGQPVPLPFIDEIAGAFGAPSLGSVEAYVGGAAARANEQLGSSAFTVGGKIAFARPPDLWTAAHEAAHVIQQRAGAGPASQIGQRGDPQERQADEAADRASRGGSAALPLARAGGSGHRLQFFVEQQREDGHTWRISDDMKMALRIEKTAAPNRHCYATKELVSAAGKILTRLRSAISLEVSASDSFTLGENLLQRVIPTNTGPEGATSGNSEVDGMLLIPDCGDAANTVMQGVRRGGRGVYRKRAPDSPSFGAYEFTGGARLSRPTSDGSRTEKQTEQYDYRKDYGPGKLLESPPMILGDILRDSFGGDYFEATRKYKAIQDAGVPRGEPGFAARVTGRSLATLRVDEEMGINRHAQPEVGEAYSIINDPLDETPVDPLNKPFNFHWAAVILRSGGDSITLENHYGSTFNGWYYEMYGPSTKDGQTFHEQQSLRLVGSDTGLFGDSPSTIRVRPEGAVPSRQAARWTGRRFPGPRGVTASAR